VSKFVQILKEESDVVIAGGQRKLSGKIFRIGHMGLVNEDDINVILQAIEKALPKARY
jgi:aspartate aminotransferase-like enzyme